MTWKQKAIPVKICCLFMLLVLSAGCIPKTTGTTEVAVLCVTWNPVGKQGVLGKYGLGNQGVQPDLFAGEGETHFVLPFIHEWHTFSSNLQNIEYTIKSGVESKKGRDDLLFKTIDGNDIGLDVIISYRIVREKAPYILKNVATNDEELRKNIVRTISRSKPRDIFGELTTEEFYVSENRVQKSERAKKIMNEMLEPYGVMVEAVLTKDYRFNPAYQKAIEERKIADQMAEKNKAGARAAEQEYKRKLEEAIGEVNKMQAEVDGEYRRGQIEANAYFDSKFQIAKAIETEGITEAKAIKEMNDSLAGPGGKTLVKLKVAEALKGKNILLLPLTGGGMDLKTTDINRLLETYGLQKATAKPILAKKPVAAEPSQEKVTAPTTDE